MIKLSEWKKGGRPAVLWQGNDGFLVSDGDHTIATDLDLFNPERKAPPTVDLDELCGTLDWLLITHGHEDHFNAATVAHLVKHSRCRFAIPQSCIGKAFEIKGLSERARFVAPGDSFGADGVPVSCVRAVHGHIGGCVYSGASMLDCGYRFSIGGLRFYQPGDTLLLEEHMEMQGVDVLFLSPTEHNTWIENSVKLIHFLKPSYVILQHHSTYSEEDPRNYFWAHGYTGELLAALEEEERARCIIPDQNSGIYF